MYRELTLRSGLVLSVKRYNEKVKPLPSTSSRLGRIRKASSHKCKGDQSISRLFYSELSTGQF